MFSISASLRLARWAALLLFLFHPPVAHAENGETSAEAEPSFHVFGYFSQAYAISDGNQFLGITKEGTADYRTFALLARVGPSEDRQVVVKLGHERLGASKLEEIQDDVQLKWAFMHLGLGESTSIDIGRVPVPLGIYNEIRDVGTLLPFFRPPSSFYGEIAFATETIDGVRASHDFAQGSPWSLQAAAYFGRTRVDELAWNSVGTARIDGGLGARLWLTTPVPGLRFGVSGQRLPLSHSLVLLPGQKGAVVSHWMLSGEARLRAFDLRGEYRRYHLTNISGGAYYLQLGVLLSKRFRLEAQSQTTTLQGGLGNLKLDADLALGLSFRFTPQYILKLEGHRNRGFLSEGPIPVMNPLVTSYAILSLSTAF